MDKLRPKLGLALSGSGNRTTFYIGFLEVFQEEGIAIDFISASSGGSLVAAAYACGTLKEFKEFAFSLNKDNVKDYLTGSSSKGGMYSLDVVEETMRDFTKGKHFEEVRPLMAFATVDIENGEVVNLCMGDIARAARISCTLPGIFQPVKWGARTLVDGGLLSLLPLFALKQFPVDVTVGINMRGTKHIFSDRQITLKKVFNMFKKILLIDAITSLLASDEDKELDFETNPNLFSVIGKSLDLAIEAGKRELQEDLTCDLMITPEKLPNSKISLGSRYDSFNIFLPYYELGRKTAHENIPHIKKLIADKVTHMEKTNA